MGSRNLNSSRQVYIGDGSGQEYGIFSNNVVNKSVITLPSTIMHVNTYINSSDVSGTLPRINL
jgi:hypothetical protein